MSPPDAATDNFRTVRSPEDEVSQTRETPHVAGLIQVGTVFVPVSDQDRALAFYTEKLGFEKRGDFPYRGGRWIEVGPPTSTIALALVPQGEGVAADRERTLCAIATTDIDAVHATLQSRGVDVDPVIGRVGSSRPGLFSLDTVVADPMPPQFCFRDVDGNRFLIVMPG